MDETTCKKFVFKICEKKILTFFLVFLFWLSTALITAGTEGDLRFVFRIREIVRKKRRIADEMRFLERTKRPLSGRQWDPCTRLAFVLSKYVPAHAVLECGTTLEKLSKKLDS